jgi:hypothetical protein
MSNEVKNYSRGKICYDNAVLLFRAIQSNHFHTGHDLVSFFNMKQAHGQRNTHDDGQNLLGKIQTFLDNDTVAIHNFGKELMLKPPSTCYGSLQFHFNSNNTLKETVKTLLKHASPLPIKELQDIDATVHRYYDWLLFFMDRTLEKFAEEHNLHHHASLLPPLTPNPEVTATAYTVPDHLLYKNTLPTTASRFFYQYDDF